MNENRAIPSRPPAGRRARRPVPVALLLLLAVLVAAPRPLLSETGEGGEIPVSRKKARKQARKEEKMRKKAEASRGGGRYEGQAAEDLVRRARDYIGAEKYLKAQEILLFLEDNERARDVQNEVKLLLAESYYGQGGTLNWVEALSRYRSFLTFYPTSPQADLAQYRIGMCYLNQAPKPTRDQSPAENALFEFQKLLELYPNSEWADDAQQRVHEARELLADHEMAVADFYFRHKGWEAAILRLQGVLSDYPDYSDKPEVYRMLAEAHYRMGSSVEGDVYAKRYEEMEGRDIKEPAKKKQEGKKTGNKEKRGKRGDSRKEKKGQEASSATPAGDSGGGVLR